MAPSMPFDQIGGLIPPEVPQHLAGQDDRARIDFVLVGVVRRRAVRRFEHGVTGDVVDVAAGSDTDAPTCAASASDR